MLGAFDSYAFEWGTVRYRNSYAMSDPECEVYREYSEVKSPEKVLIKEMLHRSLLDLATVNPLHKESAIKWFLDPCPCGEGLYLTFKECCEYLGLNPATILRWLQKVNFTLPVKTSGAIRALRS